MLAGSAPIAQAASTVIPKDSFSSFDDFWKYLYPWGSDHNGSTYHYLTRALRARLM